MSPAKQMTITPEIFNRFPGYRRGVLVARDVENGQSPPELALMLRKEEAEVRSQFAGVDLNELPRLTAWREAFKQVGIKPTKYRPSIDGLFRRVMQGHDLPSISTLVDIGNIFSLRHRLPVGGHAMDDLKTGMTLREAQGDEVFVPLGTDAVEHPDAGEIIFVDDQTIMTRRWVWRQGLHTLLQPETRLVEFNIDALPPVETSEVEQIGIELGEMVRQYCGGETSFDILTGDRPQIDLV